eukprot:COSAG01_NODE_55282_length_326_cov_0.845815_1_plen_108_part_11
MMDSIAAYKDLHLVDLSGDSVEDVSQDFLLTVLRAIFQSNTVKPMVQVPLAVRYNDLNALEKITRAKSLLKAGAQSELSHDARPLVYAAYHDRGQVVRCLLSVGFDIE